MTLVQHVCTKRETEFQNSLSQKTVSTSTLYTTVYKRTILIDVCTKTELRDIWNNENQIMRDVIESRITHESK